MTQVTNGTEQPKAIFSHSMQFPGAPLTTVLSACALLIGAYGIQHDIQMDPNFSTDSLTTGNVQADARFQADYMQFKMMLDGLANQYSRVVCTAQSNGIVLYMKFTCY